MMLGMTRKEVSNHRCQIQCQIGHYILPLKEPMDERDRNPYHKGNKLPIDTYLGGGRNDQRLTWDRVCAEVQS